MSVKVEHEVGRSFARNYRYMKDQLRQYRERDGFGRIEALLHGGGGF